VNGALLLLLTLSASEPAGLPAATSPPILKEIGFDQRLGEALPLDTAFKDDTGKDVHLGDYFGKKPVVLSLNYYGCPMLCTVTLTGLASALNILSMDAGKEFEVVTVSFDPKEGQALAAEKKANYLTRYKRPTAAAGWHFLTGDQTNIDRLTKAVGFRYTWDAETRQFAHPAGIMILTPEGRIARYLYGIEYAPRDLRFALVEASAGKIGTLTDQAILYCYQYDPVTGRYGASIMRVLRVLSVLTFVALVAFIAAMLRRERAASLAAAHGGR
jgi:protein SCO1/2